MFDMFVDKDVLMRGGKVDIHSVFSLLRRMVRLIYHVFRKGETMKSPLTGRGFLLF